MTRKKGNKILLKSSVRMVATELNRPLRIKSVKETHFSLNSKTCSYNSPLLEATPSIDRQKYLSVSYRFSWLPKKKCILLVDETLCSIRKIYDDLTMTCISGLGGPLSDLREK